jgi:hypothetical protein
MSWMPEVIADSSGEWVGNQLRFATREEAEANVRDLRGRWYLVIDTRVMESTDPVNYRWVEGHDTPRGWMPGHCVPVEAPAKEESK